LTENPHPARLEWKAWAKESTLRRPPAVFSFTRRQTQVPPKSPGRPFFTLLHARFFSFSIVLAIGFLLLVSLIISVFLAALGLCMSGRFPLPPAVWQAWVLSSCSRSSPDSLR
jgi:uncharacterized RDD family membrane protein YckC